MDNRISLSDLNNDDSLLSWDDLFEQEKQEEEPFIDKDFFKSLEALSKQEEAKEKPPHDQSYWENLFNEMNFPGMDLMAVTYFSSSLNNPIDTHIRMRRLIRDFARLLSYNYVMDLRSAGLSEEAIFYMKKGKIPENYTVHLKYPLEYGGSLDFNNMVLIQDKPFHDMIHTYFDKQLISEKGVEYPSLLYVPVPVGKVYVPFSLFTGSGGKNKQDRSVYAGYSSAALNKIALKSMPGR